MLPQATTEQYQAQQRLIVATLALTRREWARMGEDFDTSWEQVGPRVELLTASAQLGAARAGVAYVPRVLDELGTPVEPEFEVAPRAFAGVASDGRPLDSLLAGSVVTAKQAVAGGAATADALAVGGRWLDMTVHTQVADASRAATGVSITARPEVGWVRVVNVPSCGRCTVLAGRVYRWSQGFQRHPRCDCSMLPQTIASPAVLDTTPRSLFDSMSSAEQDKGFTKDGARAIRDGADPAQVVNARRGATGMAPAGARLTNAEIRMLRGGRDRGGLQRRDVFGQQLFTTTEGTTRRGLSYRALSQRGGGPATDVRPAGARYRSARAPRLMPESIYEIATDRQDAIRLLRLNGFLT